MKYFLSFAVLLFIVLVLFWVVSHAFVVIPLLPVLFFFGIVIAALVIVILGLRR